MPTRVTLSRQLETNEIHGRAIEALQLQSYILPPSHSLLSPPHSQRERESNNFFPTFSHFPCFDYNSHGEGEGEGEGEMVRTEMNWWEKMVIPMRKVWIRISRNFGFRKTGLIKLYKDVRTCEYEDVHILWELLKRNEAELARSRKGRSWRSQWAQCSPLLCH